MAQADDPLLVVEAEAAHHGLTLKQLLDALARQSRIDVSSRPTRPSFVPHRLGDFD
ncbi:hypothetical protein ACIRD3_35530 [Kitasatospora sp. NPDC093550]|uniref:hypothetical protein n=1 Tax=Kitasatospora sp. NPDC093550 TaxID=3364089 RepID=UPI00380359E7